MKLHALLLIAALAFANVTIAQNGARNIKTDNEIYIIDGDWNFVIIKKDLKSGKELYKAASNIPDKSKGQAFYREASKATFDLVGDNIVVFYDVWHVKNGTKDC